MKRKIFNASIAFQIIPKTKDEGKAIDLIDKIIAMVKKSGVSFEVGPMETTMEGDLDNLLEIVRKAQYISIREGATSVFTNIKVLYDPKGVMTIEEKITKHR